MKEVDGMTCFSKQAAKSAQIYCQSQPELLFSPAADILKSNLSHLDMVM